MADHHELIAAAALRLYPVTAAVTRPVQGIRALRHDAFQAHLAGRAQHRLPSLLKGLHVADALRSVSRANVEEHSRRSGRQARYRGRIEHEVIACCEMLEPEAGYAEDRAPPLWLERGYEGRGRHGQRFDALRGQAAEQCLLSRGADENGSAVRPNAACSHAEQCQGPD